MRVGRQEGGRRSADRGRPVEVIDVSAHEVRRIAPKKWRELIKTVWEADPLPCLKCSREPNEVR